MRVFVEAAEALQISLLAGEIMLANGAETSRVEDTMQRILVALGYPNAEAFVTATGVFASIGGVMPLSGIKRVFTRSYHMEKLAKVNELSRNLVSGTCEPDEAYTKLTQIKHLPPYPLGLRVFCSGIACFCFCYMLKGLWMDCLCAFVNGLLVYLALNILSKNNVSSFLTNIINGALISLTTLLLLNLHIGVNMDSIIVGALMPLVPGIAMINAIRDILTGDYLSGSSRMAEALMTAIALATGVGTVLQIWRVIFGGFIL
jgi:uncharacterized membrane protein YjjP (DUF1212 family)